jgi:antitoxin component YwqK of YwqJK toxin-antitoxin module
MKGLTLIMMMCATFFTSQNLSAQVVDEVAGRTYFYYDETTKKKVKEIYHHKQVVKIIPDPQQYGSYRDTILYRKNGPYTRYFENGNLECSGYFKDEKKDSLWKYYDANGTIIRTERWVNGKQYQYP